MNTKPQMPIARPAHITREAVADRMTKAVNRTPVARTIEESLESVGPRDTAKRFMSAAKE